MQTIGKMENGRILTALTAAEYKVLTVIETELMVLDPVAAHSAPPTTATGKATKIRPIRPKSRTASAKPETGKPICKNCGKPITRKKGQIGMTPQCCTAACLAEFNRTYAREHWRAKHGKTTACPDSPRGRDAATTMPPNPADPFLTNEQRKEIMARRLKLIAESAQRHADD